MAPIIVAFLEEKFFIVPQRAVSIIGRLIPRLEDAYGGIVVNQDPPAGDGSVRLTIHIGRGLGDVK